MAYLDDLHSALIKADAAGDSAGAKALADEIRAQTPAKQESTFLGKVKGAGEAALSVATGIPASIAGGASGIARNVVSGTLGTPEGTRIASERAKEVSQGLTYEPRSEEGKTYLSDIGNLFETSKLGGLGPTEAVTLSAMSPARVAASARDISGRATTSLRNIGRGEPDMAGMGAAMTDVDRIRLERAGALPVPIKLTKGQATRSFEQQQFERETAKLKEGEPLRQRFADQNERILQNFDAWVDQTGSEAGSLRATGQAVTEAIVDKSKRAKAQIRAAYEKARESGDMQEKLDASPLTKYLAENQAEAINAPVLTSVDTKLSSLLGKGKDISINDLEEIRKMVGKLSGKDATNNLFGKEVKSIIDDMTEGKGGAEYKAARALRARYGQEFENRSVVNKLISNKPGTMDRAVAYEDVFNHSILKGSLDDVRAVRRTLQTAGDQGAQAWKELQGATVQHLKDEITKNVATDIRGNKIVSPARLDRLVTELDKDGKLDFIFGKKGAQQIRDVNDISKDVFTSPPGSINTSNTASILIGLLDTAVSGVSGAPLPIGTAINFGVKRLQSRALNKKVQGALNPEGMVPLSGILQKPVQGGMVPLSKVGEAEPGRY